MSRIAVIGISGGEALSSRAKELLGQARTILASRRLHDMFRGYPEFGEHEEKVRVINSVDETVAFLRKSRGNNAVLASGDPLFFGIGRRLLEQFPKERVEILPALSSVQLAFARVKEPWEDAFFMSLHGPRKRDWDMGDLPLLLELHGKLAILTGGENTPRKIAAALPGEAKVCVLERLGQPGEGMKEGSPAEIRRMKFAEPNLMLVISAAHESPVLGIEEAEFAHARGLITKDEVRAVVLHKLRLPRKGVFWDIGAGSGSVSVEAKRLSPALRVHAIEKRPAQVKHIMKNAQRLAAGVTVIRGEAPEALEGLPAPDRVFVGGAGGRLPEIIGAVSRRMKKGIIVGAAVTLESLDEALDALDSEGFETGVSSVSVSRTEPLKGRRHLRALNPVFVIKGVR